LECRSCPRTREHNRVPFQSISESIIEELGPSAEERLYQEMKCTAGGVMLLVRLHADLLGQPPEVIRELRTFDLHPDVAALPAITRLQNTYTWLERQFGSSNAARAVVETAAQVLKQASAVIAD
jgi:hypothetical protein